MSDPVILILAAGESSRMAPRDKLLEPVGGIPLLRHATLNAVATGLRVLVTLAPDRPLRAAVLADLDVQKVVVDNAVQGMSVSLKAGLAATHTQTPVMLLLADLPDLTAADLSNTLTAWRECPDLILRGTDRGGRPGHPVCFPPWAKPALLGLTADQGARDFLKSAQARTRFLPLPDHHATTDLDTPEDWARWRALHGQ